MITRTMLLLGAALAAFWPTIASAQYVYVPRYSWNYYRSPASAAADLVRAYGETAVNLAEARKIHAQARSLEIANSIEEVKAYWERKTIGEIERYKRMHHLLDSQKLQNSKSWDRLKNHPELTGIQIINGTAQNFLLNRLDGTLLAYDFAGGQTTSAEFIRQLTLTPQEIHGLKLRQRTTNNQTLVFRADDGAGLKIDGWPYSLGAPEFDAKRNAFEKARADILSDSKNGRLSYEKIKALSQALADLQEGFHQRYAGSAKTEKTHGSRMETWNQYNTGKRFLTSLEGEVRRVTQTQSASVFDGSLKFEGDNLLALLTYMSRSGLDFAPAEPGDEPVYNKIFNMMRDLYVTVAENDASIVPVERNRKVGEK